MVSIYLYRGYLVVSTMSSSVYISIEVTSWSLQCLVVSIYLYRGYLVVSTVSSGVCTLYSALHSNLFKVFVDNYSRKK